MYTWPETRYPPVFRAPRVLGVGLQRGWIQHNISNSVSDPSLQIICLLHPSGCSSTGWLLCQSYRTSLRVPVVSDAETVDTSPRAWAYLLGWLKSLKYSSFYHKWMLYWLVCSLSKNAHAIPSVILSLLHARIINTLWILMSGCLRNFLLTLHWNRYQVPAHNFQIMKLFHYGIFWFRKILKEFQYRDS